MIKLEKPVIKLNSLEKTVVHIPTEESATELMRVFECGGWVRIRTRTSPTQCGVFYEGICFGAGINFNEENGRFGHAPKEIYITKGWNVISKKDFYAQQPEATPDKIVEINAYFDSLEK